MRRREGFVPELGEAVGQGVAALRGHPLRTSLGMLAILVAVATIAVVVTALDGVRRFAEVNAARTFGSETFVIAQVAPGTRISRKELELKLQRNPAIKRQDVRFLDRYSADRVIYAPIGPAQRRGHLRRPPLRLRGDHRHQRGDRRHSGPRDRGGSLLPSRRADAGRPGGRHRRRRRRRVVPGAGSPRRDASGSRAAASR